MESLKSVLMRRDGLSSKEADEAIRVGKAVLDIKLSLNENCDYFMEEEFGLEPDYIFDLL